jgi:putative flippase GtrA
MNKKEIFFYGIAGLLTNILHFCLFYLFLNVLNVRVFLSALMAYLIAITFSFFANNFYVYDQKDRRLFGKKITRYIAVIAASALIQSTLTELLSYYTAAEIAWLISALTVAVLNYLALKRFVFS